LLGLSTRVKVGLVVGLCLSVLSWLYVAHRHKAQEPADLFAYALTPRQLEECSQRLSQLGVDHRPNTDGNNLKVTPEKRLALLNQLSMEGLPHEDNSQLSQGPLPASRREALASQQAQLQQTIAASLRGMQGIEDATVQLAIPENAAFAENNHPTASVLLRLQTGYQLPRNQSSGIAKFVAGAVPDLRSQDVTVVDQSGIERPHAGLGGQIDSVQFELQEHVDVYLASKAQRLLDMAYGRGNALVIVDATLDFSQYEVKHKDVGAPGDSENITVTQKTDESYENRPTPPEDDVEVGANGKKYVKLISAERRNPDEAFTFRVYKLPRLERVTCSVLMEAGGQQQNALQMVRGAIGFDATRGDEITVSVVPLHRDAAGLKEIGPLTVPASPSPGADPIALLGLAGAFGLGAVIWGIGQRKVRLQQPHLTPSPALSTATQCDLNHRPDGRTPQGATATQPRVLEKLEELARHSPRETASKLRSYMDTNTMS
jgi:flagellar M-ring protein FliF